MARLSGKRTLITGATSDIGFETAKQFLAEGARLIITGSSQENADAAVSKLDGDVIGVGANSLDMDAQRHLADVVKEHFDQLDAAFLNAGVSDWRHSRSMTRPASIDSSTSTSRACSSWRKH